MQRMRPYKMQLSRRVPLAPNKMATGFTRNILRIAIMIPPIAVEKYSLAFSIFPSPSVFATMALPPVPIMKPRALMPIRKGMIRLTAAKALFPTKLETKSPSTTL